MLQEGIEINYTPASFHQHRGLLVLAPKVHVNSDVKEALNLKHHSGSHKPSCIPPINPCIPVYDPYVCISISVLSSYVFFPFIHPFEPPNVPLSKSPNLASREVGQPLLPGPAVCYPGFARSAYSSPPARKSCRHGTQVMGYIGVT